ncbi:hypothetical protein PNK_1691 [Candidatus Protochlamydia naegleriophila]|uniref:Uncharacterized protein n=1 Tax=Candidatus Protochlamydia naegleriophila TaxID=389348 RepID=A0A0U5JES5_9BACT|nr:hypothetical protein [Candidatus Protochlamydia naegleriophila]CUI17300.1 hypothetical protein PNK_1691 [Candidatus Protochlamydia naegleriophila]
MMAVQLITSAWAWLSSNASTCTQSQAKDPQVNFDNSSTETVKSQSLVVQLFKQSVSHTLMLLGDEAEVKGAKAWMVLRRSAVRECYDFALRFFTFHFTQDSTLVTNEKKWSEIFSKIEGIIDRSIKEIVTCSDDVFRGYYVTEGMPLSLAKEKGESPIPFVNMSENVAISKAGNYTEFLCEVSCDRTPYFSKMKDLDSTIMCTIVKNGVFYELPDQVEEFIQGKMKKICDKY